MGKPRLWRAGSPVPALSLSQGQQQKEEGLWSTTYWNENLMFVATESSHLVPGRVGLLARSWRSLCFLEAMVKLEKVLRWFPQTQHWVAG